MDSAYVTQFIELQAITLDSPIGISEKLSNTLQGISIHVVSNSGSFGVTYFPKYIGLHVALVFRNVYTIPKSTLSLKKRH